MFSTYKLNKQADNIQPWCTPFPILNQSIPCLVLTVFSWVAYRFLRRQVRWSGILISLRIFHSLLWSTQRLLCTQWSRSARSVAQSCLTLCDPMNRSMPGLPVHHQLPEFTQTHLHRVSDAIQPSHPLSSPSPPAPNSSQHQIFSNESTLRMRWPKYWSFSFSIIPSKEIPGLISFRMDWLDLLAVQGTYEANNVELEVGIWTQIYIPS